MAFLNDPLSRKNRYPQDYFQLPVNRSVKLSGTFGELRSNHFHAGFDIKSLNGSVGEPVLATADGYVSRVKVQPGGYGNAIYINHPNGFTSVYAHLDRFEARIADFVKKSQYAQQKFSVDLSLSADQFRFKQGDRIGRLGNSGSSSGPHLHFEIRKSTNQEPINPALFGLPLADAVPPNINKLRVYYLNEKKETYHNTDYNLIPVAPGRYTIKDTLRAGAWRVGFGLKTYDKMSGVPNSNGVYAIEMRVDDSLQYSCTFERISFSKTRYLNAHIDYGARKNKQGFFNRCYVLPGNKLAIYDLYEDKGVVKLYKSKPGKVEMTVYDAYGNKSILSFYIKRDDNKMIEQTIPAFKYIAHYDKPLRIVEPNMSAVFPAGSFYENHYIQYQLNKDQSDGVYSDMHHLHDPVIPLHKYFELSIAPKGLQDQFSQKAFIASCQPDGSYINCGGKMVSGEIRTKVREYGDFCIMIDTIGPTIRPVQFRRNMTGMSKMQFKIDDDIRTGGSARGLTYRATVDGNWILFEYDSKRDLLTHRFDERTGKGDHLLKLTVRDDRNNTSVFEGQFTL
jgi:hypothetical protein